MSNIPKPELEAMQKAYVKQLREALYFAYGFIQAAHGNDTRAQLALQIMSDALELERPDER